MEWVEHHQSQNRRVERLDGDGGRDQKSDIGIAIAKEVNPLTQEAEVLIASQILSHFFVKIG